MRDLLTTIVAWVLLHCMSLSLSVLGFQRTLGLTRRLAPEVDGNAANDALVQRVVRAIGRAKSWHLRGTAEDCLPVALTGMCMLRRLGTRADLIIGVQTFPFNAHAWVEANQQVIDFPPDKYKRFSSVNMTRQAREAHADRTVSQN